MDNLHLVPATILALALLGGCGPQPCMDGEGIWPGQGVSIGGAPLCIGETAGAVAERLGPTVSPSVREGEGEAETSE